MVPVDSVGVPRDPTYSGTPRETTLLPCTGLSPSMVDLSKQFRWQSLCNSHVEGPTTPQRKTPAVWAKDPGSLAATWGIEFSFFSSRYLDVSVPWVGHMHLCIQCMLIRVPRDQRLFDSYPKLFADFHALQRLLTPRHPPHALSSLAA